ncbi:hypothetical protein A9Q81_15450 [Gammaproteobacteria bacterium 42_54_T18]|nr:hypothetical protein A9Q81_15450 [Gammaproteobacteria bacterium 42_54_T18]
MMILRQLMIFLAGALCLLSVEFVAELSGVASWGGDAKKNVVITQADVQRIQQELVEKIGSDPTSLQLESAIAHAVENEILVNEALLMGLHNIDPVVRQRILLNMVFVGGKKSEETLFENAKSLDMFRNDIVVRRRLIERMKKIIASQVSDAPTKDELLQYFKKVKENQASRYQREKAVRLVHGYFTTSNNSIVKIEEWYRQWVVGELSDSHMQLLANSVLVNSSVYITENVERKLFGKDISALISDVKLARADDGFLPIQKKPAGFHFIRVIDARPSQYRPYIEVENKLRLDYIDQKRKSILVSTLAELRAEYDVIQ